MAETDIKKILEKYREELEEELPSNNPQNVIAARGMSSQSPISSIEYQTFRKERMSAAISFYEKGCLFAEKILKVKPDKKDQEALEESIKIAHLNFSPEGAVSFALLGPLIFILAGITLAMVIPTLLGKPYSLFLMLFILIVGIVLIFVFKKMPEFLADNYRLKASNEMVLCIFYVVTYMRHTSNLELAIKFAADHLTGPLALDLRKVIWDIETQKFSNIKDSLDNYLETWRKWNMEFIEAFHLIESSLYEPSETRRIQILEKGLDVILEETYEKMMHYAHNLKGPITMLHMMGIILPILGLVILPLVVSFMKGVKWYYIAALYNVIIPILVYYLGKSILSKRPTGYGELDLSEYVPELSKYKYILFKLGTIEIKIQPVIISILVGSFCLLLALLPVILHTINFPDYGFGGAYGDDPTTTCKKPFCLLDYREIEGTTKFIGPFGLIAGLLSLFFPLALALSVGLYYKYRTEKLIKIREQTTQLEQEFASGLFQLGNRLGDEIPAETAFGKVAKVMEGTTTGDFFSTVSTNITKLGVSVSEALFNPRIGALASYPSKMIQSSMKVLMQAIKKGPKTAAQALLNMARYIKEMHRVDERLKDLLADVISSMKAQISVMTPAIAGIVIGITSMITNILGKLGPLIAQKGVSSELGGLQEDFFGLGIPTYYFQTIVGIYVVQITYLLTILTNGIENGSDKLNEQYLIGKNLIRSTIIYIVIAGIIILVFNYIANSVIANMFQ